MTKYIVTRDVTTEECWWLADTIPKDTIVYKCIESTYGAVQEFPATLNKDGNYPFFELPYNAIESI